MTVQYLIDSENVGDFWISLLELPADQTELIVFYTRNSPHMSYESLIRLKESDRTVTFIKCYEGTNALDFQLVTELGYRISKNESDRFVIVTNDTGFDAAVKYWRRSKKSVKRITGKECRNLERRKKEDLTVRIPSVSSGNAVRPSADPSSEAAAEVKVNEPAAAAVLAASQEVRSSRPVLRDAETAAEPDSPETGFPEDSFDTSFESEETDYDSEPDMEDSEIPDVDIEDISAVEDDTDDLDANVNDIDDFGDDIFDTDKFDMEDLEAEEAETEESESEASETEESESEESESEESESEAFTEDEISDPDFFNGIMNEPDETEDPEDSEIVSEETDSETDHAPEYRDDDSADPVSGQDFPNSDSAKSTVETAALSGEIPEKYTEGGSEESDGMYSGDVTGIITPENGGSHSGGSRSGGSHSGGSRSETQVSALTDTKQDLQPADSGVDKRDSGKGENRPAAAAAAVNTGSAPEEDLDLFFSNAEVNDEVTESDDLEQPQDDSAADTPHRSKSHRSRSRRSKSAAKKLDRTEETAEPAVVEEQKNSAKTRKSVGKNDETDAVETAGDSALKETGISPISENEEIARIVACIGADNLAELHNQLATFYGDQGKDIYLSIKNNARTIPVLKPDLKQKFAYYCEIIFARSDYTGEYPSDISEYLLNVREKLNNLNSLRYALQKHYGKEKGRRFYFLLKPFAKTMYQM